MAALFRERALAGKGASDPVDEPVRVVHVPAWLALVLALVVLAAGSIWLFAGTIAVTATGSGAVMSAPTNVRVLANAYGTLSTAVPAPGTKVREGQTVAVIEVGGVDNPIWKVTSPINGVVVGVGPGVDATVGSGDYLGTIAPDGLEQVAYLYIAPGKGELVHPGMPARLYPDSSDTSADGFLMGTVATVSPLPVSVSHIAYQVGDPALAESLAANGPVVEVQVALEPADTPSGWKWSRTPGPGGRLTSGVPTSGDVVLDEVPPYQAFFGWAG